MSNNYVPCFNRINFFVIPSFKKGPWKFAFQAVTGIYSMYTGMFWKIKRKSPIMESFSSTIIKGGPVKVFHFTKYLGDNFCCSWRDINKYILYVDKISITTMFLTAKFNKSVGTNFSWPAVIRISISYASTLISAYDMVNWTKETASTVCCSSLICSLFLLISFYDIHNEKKV